MENILQQEFLHIEELEGICAPTVAMASTCTIVWDEPFSRPFVSF